MKGVSFLAAATLIFSVTCSLGMQTPSPSPTQRLRASSGVVEGLIIHRVPPVYPPTAKAKHIKGDVILRIAIDQQGNVTEAAALKGDPILAEAAIDAVKQWKYKPYVDENGSPIEVETTVLITFKK